MPQLTRVKDFFIMSWLTETVFMQNAREQQLAEWAEKEMSACGNICSYIDPVTKMRSVYVFRCGECNECQKRKKVEFALAIRGAENIYFTGDSDERRKLHRRLGSRENYISWPITEGYITFSPIEIEGVVTEEELREDWDAKELFTDILFGDHKGKRSGSYGIDPEKKEKIEEEYLLRVKYGHFIFADKMQELRAMHHANEETYNLLPDNEESLQHALNQFEKALREYADSHGFAYTIIRRTKRNIDVRKLDWSIGRDIMRERMMSFFSNTEDEAFNNDIVDIPKNDMGMVDPEWLETPYEDKTVKKSPS